MLEILVRYEPTSELTPKVLQVWGRELQQIFVRVLQPSVEEGFRSAKEIHVRFEPYGPIDLFGVPIVLTMTVPTSPHRLQRRSQLRDLIVNTAFNPEYFPLKNLRTGNIPGSFSLVLLSSATKFVQV